jgi:hypothetical protein
MAPRRGVDIDRRIGEDELVAARDAMVVVAKVHFPVWGLTRLGVVAPPVTGDRGASIGEFFGETSQPHSVRFRPIHTRCFPVKSR